MNEDLKELVREFEKHVEDLKRYIDEQEKPKSLTRWRAGKDEYHFFMGSCGDLYKSIEDGNNTDDIRHNHGNYFPLELKDHLESETVMQIRFIQQITVIAWQLEPERMGKAYDMGENHDLCLYGMRGFCDGKFNLLRMFNFTTQELANQAWEMLSEDIKEWLKK